VLVDVVVAVDALPECGGDVLAGALDAVVGGGFNLMVAAARQGAAVRYGGAHGTGPFGELARAALRAAGIPVLLPPRPTDTGAVVVIVDAAGERTLLSGPAAVANPTADELAVLGPVAGDAVTATGYALLDPAGRDGLLGWLPTLSAGVLVVLDPGPLAPAAQPVALATALARVDWCTASAREAALITHTDDPVRAARRLAGTTRCGAVVRIGADGCVLATADEDPVRVAGLPVTAVDSTGAGDAHTGVFVAALLAGREPGAAAALANAAAAYAVTVRGPATAPTAAELAAWLAHRA
jgi:sugar/nucleoside kinase (ribokinase family)